MNNINSVPLKIMVIDDEESVLDTIKIVLNYAGYETVLLSKAPNIDEISKHKPALILLDLLLVGNSGQDICIQLKSNKLTKQIPIILFSAHNRQMIEAAMNACGADGYLAKPFDIDELIDLVKKFTYE